MLPNSVGVAVTFFALQSIGRVPAMINFSSGAVSVRAACKAAKVSVVLTSRAFVEKARLTELVRAIAEAVHIVYLEDLRERIGLGDKIAGLLAGGRQRVARRPDDPAVILFTSGSEGKPKGVVLSHRNMLANAAQCLARVDANGEDLVFNVLPVFHSFGLTGGLMMPLVGGIPVYLYPSPLHYRIVPELIYDTGATIMFGTDTFLRGYARAAHPYDLRTIRLIVAGAEAVKDAHAAHLHGALRRAHPGRLRRHRDGAGAGHEHADRQPVRHRRPPVAADAGAARAGGRHQRGRPAVRARGRT